MRRLFSSAALVILLVLTGCSVPGGSEEPTGLGKITTIDQLVDAAVDAGMVCNWEQTDKVKDAVASGVCSDTAVLMMFSDSAAAQQRADEIMGFSENALLVGENWVINSTIGAELQSVLGGELVGG
ncbi:hypothetical protein [Microbacterium sp. YY-01]|uniref:hypothetical protein n=1 Tax=Microbacterium sp. YY-01 TaxID=3421634 RepID=UPI003D1691D1